MNYNPYYFTPYITQGPARAGIFNSLFRNTRSINWSSILNGTQKALNIANQAIPVIKQVTPMMQNAKTMFKVMNEFKKVETPVTVDENITPVTNDIVNDEVITTETSIANEGPTFFI